MIKTLNINNFNEAISIASIRKRIGGLKNQIDAESAKQYFLENNEGKVAFGFFKNEELISWIGIKLHENKTRGKFWTISFLFSKFSHNWFSFNNIEIKSLFQKVFEYTENLGYYDFYYSVGIRIMNAYEKQWKKNNFLEIGRYDLITLGSVPANTKPEIELYWLLMNKEIKSEEVVIKKRSLKEVFRKSQL
jgi:hypothetical protein